MVAAQMVDQKSFEEGGLFRINDEMRKGTYAAITFVRLRPAIPAKMEKNRTA
jgi:hypothetical protein